MSHLYYFHHGGYDRPSALTAIKYTSDAHITYQTEHLRRTGMVLPGAISRKLQKIWKLSVCVIINMCTVSFDLQ